ncbi:MAG: hypothetical protein U0892_13700 [Pirellulales bacterium]
MTGAPLLKPVAANKSTTQATDSHLDGSIETPPATAVPGALNSTDQQTKQPTIPSANSNAAEKGLTGSASLDTTEWHSLPKSNDGIDVKFPVVPEAYDPTEEMSEGIDKEFATVINSALKPTALRAVQGKLKFVFGMAALELGGMPVSEYLKRVLANVEVMHPGFRLAEHQPKTRATNAIDVVLQSATTTRIARITQTGKIGVSAYVDGPTDLSYDNPTVQAFIGSLRINNEPIAMTVTDEPKLEPERHASRPDVQPQIGLQLMETQPLEDDWTNASGNKIRFTTPFPSREVRFLQLANLFTASKQRDQVAKTLETLTNGELGNLLP